MGGAGRDPLTPGLPGGSFACPPGSKTADWCWADSGLSRFRIIRGRKPDAQRVDRAFLFPSPLSLMSESSETRAPAGRQLGSWKLLHSGPSLSLGTLLTVWVVSWA